MEAVVIEWKLNSTSKNWSWWELAESYPVHMDLIVLIDLLKSSISNFFKISLSPLANPTFKNLFSHCSYLLSLQW